jgi:hypothetical protein
MIDLWTIMEWSPRWLRLQYLKLNKIDLDTYCEWMHDFWCPCDTP